MLWLIRPGSGVEAARWTTQPTMRSVGMARESLPPGSSVSRRSLPPPKASRSKNHHGTPFIAVTIEVFSPSSGAMPARDLGQALALTATMT